MFDAVRSPVMIFPPEMIVASQFDAPMALSVANDPWPAIEAATLAEVWSARAFVHFAAVRATDNVPVVIFAASRLGMYAVPMELPAHVLPAPTDRFVQLMLEQVTAPADETLKGALAAVALPA